jgi:RNA polymerase sigma-70 factor (ECF subfamily)
MAAADLVVTDDSLSDDEVVRRVLAGETARFETLMRRYNARLYRVARSIVRDDGEAEDVTQEAYVRAYQHLAQWEGRASFATWLTRIAVHEALSRVKKTTRLRLVPEADEAASEGAVGSDPEGEAFRGEVRALLDSAIDALPADFRTVFVLRDVEELSQAETAECLGIRVETVKTRLHRARALLAKKLLALVGADPKDAFAFHLSRCDRVVAAVLARITIG